MTQMHASLTWLDHLRIECHIIMHAIIVMRWLHAMHFMVVVEEGGFLIIKAIYDYQQFLIALSMGMYATNKKAACYGLKRFMPTNDGGRSCKKTTIISLPQQS